MGILLIDINRVRISQPLCHGRNFPCLLSTPSLFPPHPKFQQKQPFWRMSLQKYRYLKKIFFWVVRWTIRSPSFRLVRQVSLHCKINSGKSAGREVDCEHLLQGRSEGSCEPLLYTGIQANTLRQWCNDDPLVPILGLESQMSLYSLGHSPSTKNGALRY